MQADIKAMARAAAGKVVPKEGTDCSSKHASAKAVRMLDLAMQQVQYMLLSSSIVLQGRPSI